ncbi:MAG: hypothetical protein OEW43_01595, partial [Elusimicrobiota bacterium]|nr:hypothetical protein [Elusimicrobiota bacterium]
MKGKSVLLILVLLVVGLVGYRIVKYNMERRNIKDSPEEKITLVKTVPAGRGDIEEIIFLNGDIRGLREVDVYTRVSGKLIKKNKEEGESVRKGEVVALIDRDEPALGFTKAEVKAPIEGTVI